MTVTVKKHYINTTKLKLNCTHGRYIRVMRSSHLPSASHSGAPPAVNDEPEKSWVSFKALLAALVVRPHRANETPI